MGSAVAHFNLKRYAQKKVVVNTALLVTAKTFYQDPKNHTNLENGHPTRKGFCLVFLVMCQFVLYFFL